MTIIAGAYFSVLLYPLVLAEATASLAGVGTTSEGLHTPSLQQLGSNMDEKIPYLRLANVLSASKALLAVMTSSFTYAKFAYLPIKQAVAALIGHSIRPLKLVLDPVYLAVRIIFAPILVPVLLVYKFAVLVYPLYVFVGAAVICGALAGLLSQRLCHLIIENIVRNRSRQTVRSGEEKQVPSPSTPTLESRSRSLAH